MAIALSVRSDLRQAIGRLRARFSDQLPYATARALTQTAADVRAAMPAELERVLDRPTAFTTRGLFIQGATKSRLVARVGFKDRQAAYMLFQIAGGARRPERRAIKLPATVGLDVHGNIPRRTVEMLIQRAKDGKRVAAGARRRLGIGKDDSLFYGRPDGRPDLPAGIFRRVRDASAGDRLVPLIVFRERAVQYRPRFNLAEFARRIIREKLEANFAEAYRAAVASRR